MRLLRPAAGLRAALALVGLVLAAPPALALEIDELPRDRIVVDLGAAFGRNSADYTVTGSADPGTAVELRLVTETGLAGPWLAAGTAGPEGRWSGAVVLDGTEGWGTDWARIEARDPSGDVARTRNRLAGGDVVAFLGQSELARLTRMHFSRSDPPALEHPGQMQITIGAADGAPPVHALVEPGAELSASVLAMARMWELNAPAGRKLHLVDLAESGSSRRDLADDSRAKRAWADLMAVVESIEADGTHIGLVLETWYAGDRGVARGWPEVFVPFYTGLDLRDRPVRIGEEIVINRSRSYRLDHVLWDLSGAGRGIFEEGETALGVYGPHRFDPQERLAGPALKIEGRPSGGLRAIERAREGSAAFLETPQIRRIAVPRRLPVALDYANGRIGEDGRMTDTPHPSAELDDGLPRFGRHLVAAALVALGHVPAEAPRFDQVTWTRDWVELGSSAGPITTARAARGETVPPGLTQVRGFDIGGVSVRAELVDGRVRVYPQDGLRLTPRDLLGYGQGGAGGYTDPEIDWRAEAWLDIPIVDVGIEGLEGFAVLPALPGDPALANTLR